LGARSSRRSRTEQAERPQIDARQQVGAEPPGGDLGGQIAVGPREEHEVADHLGVGADRPPALGLERVQQERLLAEVELAQLVEEQRPAVGGAQVAVAGRGGAGERALDVAEQRAHRAVAAQGRAVDLDQRAGELVALALELVDAAREL
jgi:hypothetical protein